MKRPRDPGVLPLQKASTRSGWPVHVRRQGGTQIEDDWAFSAKPAASGFVFALALLLLRNRSSFARSSFVVVRRVVSSVVVRRRSFVVVVVSFVVVSSHVVRSFP
jgi:hypothetical protein